MKRLFFMLILCLLPAFAGAQVIRYDTIRNESEVQRAKRELGGQARARQQTRATATQQSRQAETTTRTQRENRWEVGGSLGVSFADSEWGINVAPQIGYRITDWFTFGGGMRYNYYEGRGRYDYNLSYFGMNLYARAYPIRYIMLFVQPEVFRRWGQTYGYSDRSEVFMAMPVGAGVVIPAGRGGVTISFYYDVLQNRYTPYGNRISMSVGYSFRL
ncbi:hypothetical protein LJC45_01930 [Alistipes sp. OttesenSCG-928-B03]|nr:hypothetical protein [Alistipes sp. OttesenSCG-928-B03]